ncbi:MAG: hypothetical protein M0Q91_11255 [Methanoregula sp.]|nr:hypothetical protein [Methanoregula sp.]
MTTNPMTATTHPGLKGNTLLFLSKSTDQPAEHKITQTGHPGPRPPLTGEHEYRKRRS